MLVVWLEEEVGGGYNIQKELRRVSACSLQNMEQGTGVLSEKVKTFKILLCCCQYDYIKISEG